jgi:hypothetical protein
MSKKHLFALFLISLIFLMFSQLTNCEYQPTEQPTNQYILSSVSGWQVEYTGENGVGYCSESNGVYRLWSNGGGTIYCPTVALYKEVNVTGDFTFSAEVNSKTMESSALFLRGSLPVASSTHGCNFEYGHYGAGDFLFARNCSSEWTPTQVAHGNPNEWYTMQLNVSSAPFNITASAFDENGVLIGSYSTNYITGFSFNDIHYIGFYVWGFDPADYSFRNIEGPFDSQANLSINTQSSATTAGAKVNVFGTLLDLSGLPIQNQTVVLSYAVLGQDALIPIGSAQTDEQGNYMVQWINSASGTFILKISWSEDRSASNTTTLSFLPIEEKSTFVIESNSTVNALTFDNNTSTLSFNVTGPSGTKGCVKATISKSLLVDGQGLQAFIDGKPLNFTLTSTADSWIFTFNYSHSTHQISMNINANAHVTEPTQTQPQGSGILLFGIIILFSIILIGVTVSLIRIRKLS